MKKIWLQLGLTIVGLHALAQSPVNSSTFGVIEARQLGPGTMSGRISSIKGSASDTKVLYVGTAGGGVWKSTNAGASYNPIFDKYCQSIGAIAVSPSDAKLVYVGTGESNMRNSVSIGVGMYKSTDGGDNWKEIGLDSTEHISKIVLDPNDPNIVYVSVPGPLWSDSKHRGLYKSTDGGDTWQQILYKDEKTGCADVIIHPSNPNILYASMWQFRRMPYSFNSGGDGSGLFKSIDGGKTWKEIKDGLPEKPFGRIAMTIAPSDPSKMIAIVESKNTGLYISEDGGEHWKSQSATMNVCARPFYFSTIEVDPKNAKRIYRPAFEFAYSDDGGYSFSSASGSGGWVHSDMHALWINPENTNILYLGTDGGIYSSIDRGATWSFCHGLPVGQFYHVSHDMQDPYNVYGGLQDNGSWKAPSAAPGGIGNGSWTRVGGGDGFWTQPDIDGKTVYAEYQGGNMQRTNMSTMKGEDIQPQKTLKEEKLRWNWNTPLVPGAKNPHNLYVGAQYLYKSTDQGRTWNRISPDLTTNNKAKQQQEESGGLSADNTSAENHCTIFTIAESPLDEKIIWVGTDDGNVQYSIDGGMNWNKVSESIPACGAANGAWVSSIEPSHFSKNTVYVTIENHMYGDHNTYVVKSVDMGKTWTRLQSTEFRSFAHKICEDPVNEKLLFLGTEMGLFATLDGGGNWFLMKNNIPEYALVRDIKIQPKTNDLIIATHGRGIFIIDDIRTIRTMTAAIWNKDVHLFPTPDIILRNGRFGWGGTEISGGWNCGNPPSIQSIDYYLKNRLNSGTAELEMYDSQGMLLQTIPAGKRKGINKVYWNMRGNPPRVAAGSTKLDQAGFMAPMVLPGDYTIKLKIAGKTYESKVKCIHDAENIDLNEQARQLVYDKGMYLQKLYNKVNTDIDTISFFQNKIKADSNSKNKNNAAFTKELEKIKGEMMATKQKSMFADEERIREKISKLYGNFSNMEVKPNQNQLDAIESVEDEYNKQAEALKKAIEKFGPKISL